MIFRRKTRTARLARPGRQFRADAVDMAVDCGGQHIASEVGDAVVNGAAHFGHEGQHGAQNFSERSEVILRNPFGKLQQRLTEQRLLV